MTSNGWGQDPYHSVVQIEAEGARRGIGVVLLQPDHVVTALHVVAGIPDIRVYSKYRGRSVPANIVRVHKESDLALLTLSTPLNLPPLQFTTTPPNAVGEYLIYGYTATPEVIEMKMGLASRTFQLTSIIAPTTPQYNWLVNHGFPSPNATIIRLTDPIRHGDSGSPITDVQGNLVGIADGGLKQGTQRMNWGISAAAYIEKLWNSTEPINVPRSKLPFLKNARSDNTLFTEVGQLAIYKIFSETLSEISSTALPEDWDAVNHYREMGFESSNRDILNALVDVYEDYNSGASMAIPHGLDFDYDQANGWLETWTPNGNVEMNILIKQARSWEEAIDRAIEFQDYLLHEGNWHPSPTYTPPPPIQIPEEHFYAQSMNRVQYDVDGRIISDFTAEILIDDTYVMATSVKVLDIPLANANQIDWYYCYLMEACLVLGGFAID
ncbi:MAG: trypsin-like serine protease [Aliifodinibius sp.]|nr:trypsin-like peptidase domain-containing protein [Fodinibius sp.]NIW44594.1 trypsin-like serine protease [Gammaproteobacteria bacterium]NIX02735.1 trypsin-like serine protease [Phycisphaerae bacterium]NIY25193.1 trypsin-like serine protease [Fodinibius sp.]